jgi:predicted nucleic acid-binding protein
VTLLVDTNVVSELRKRVSLRNPGVKSWEQETDLDSVYLSAITVSELATWVARVKHRDAVQGGILGDWFNTRVMGQFATRIVPVDAEVGICAGQLHVPDPRDYRDAFIAATAIVRGMTVVTRNTAHFAPMGARVINPFS